MINITELEAGQRVSWVNCDGIIYTATMTPFSTMKIDGIDKELPRNIMPKYDYKLLRNFTTNPITVDELLQVFYMQELVTTIK